MDVIKFNDDKDCIKNLPVTEKAVSTAKFTEMVNFMFKYTHTEQENKLKWDVVDKILEVCGLAEREEKNFFCSTTNGQKYVIIKKRIPYLTTEGQIFIKDYLIKNGFDAPVVTKDSNVIKKSYSLKPFAITEEQLNNYQFTETPIVLTAIVYKINSLIDAFSCQKLSSNAVADFLVDEEMLDIVRSENGHYFRRATKKGNGEGILYKEYKASDGNVYMSNVYDKHGQFYIIDNMQKICEFNSGVRSISADRLKGVPVGEVIEEGPEEKKYSCKDCMDYRNGNCFGENDICSDFRFAYTYSAKEIENWPDEGDATYFKRKKRK